MPRPTGACIDWPVVLCGGPRDMQCTTKSGNTAGLTWSPLEQVVSTHRSMPKAIFSEALREGENYKGRSPGPKYVLPSTVGHKHTKKVRALRCVAASIIFHVLWGLW